MKAKISILVFLITITFSCQERMDKSVSFEKKADSENINEVKSNEEKNIVKDNFEIPHVEVITAELPVSLDLIDFEDRDLVQQISEGKRNRIEKEIKNYYVKDCEGNKKSYHSMKDIYLKTIQISNSSNYILFWIIFKHRSGKVNSKVLFFDNSIQAFSDYVHDFNIHALYNEEDRKLIPTNLKERFRIDSPEIELVDFDKDEFADVKLRRLYHNGTENAMEEMTIEVHEVSVDTLKVEKEWIFSK